MIGLGLIATTNSGGAKNWRQDHTEALRGRDVVILLDNDEPGRERGKSIAALLHGVARRVRVLDFSKEAWPTAPKGADVTDWVRSREGTAEELAEIVGRLPEVKPAAVEPRLNDAPAFSDEALALTFADRHVDGLRFVASWGRWNRITDNNAELIAFLQRYIGYCMTGDISEHVFVFAYGTGANGKGVFLNTIVKIFGDYATMADMNTFLASNNERHPTDLAKLRGARLVVAQETRGPLMG